MERNQPQPPATKIGFANDAEWQNFASDAREIYNSFVRLVKKPIEEKVPDVKFSVDDNDMALYLDLQHFNVMVYGVLKSGKSMLLKALIDPQLPVPSDPSPCTSALCTIKYGARKIVVFINRETKKRTEIDLENKFQGKSGKTQQEEIMEYMHNQMTQLVTNREEQSKWESVEIDWPSEILQRGYTFVDAPGLGENEVNDALVKKALKEAHLLLVVLGSPVSHDSKEQIARLHGHKDMFFVATKFDGVKEQPWVTTNREAVRKEVRDRYILSMKTALGEALPDFKGKFNDHNFHAVSAQEIVAGTKEEEWIRRFDQLKTNVCSDVRVRAADAALRRLEKLISDALEWCNGGKNDLEKKKEDQKTEQSTLSIQLEEIKKEHALVKEEFIRLVNAAKDEIRTLVTSLLDQTGRKTNFRDEANRLINEFHKSHSSTAAWKNTPDQRKRYEDRMKATVPRKFEEHIEKFWKSQHVRIQEICVKYITECKQILAKLIQMLKDLDKSMEEIMPVEGNSLATTLSNLDKIALPEASSLVGSLTKIVLATAVPSVFIGGVVGYIGVAAMGPVTLVLAVPLGAIFAFKFIKNYYEDQDYDKGTEKMREKMEQALDSFIVENTKHWVESYCKAGSDILDQVIATTSVRIKDEIGFREKKVKHIEEIIKGLNGQGEVLNKVLPAILSLKIHVQNLKNRKPFEEKKKEEQAKEKKEKEEEEIKSLGGNDASDLERSLILL